MIKLNKANIIKTTMTFAMVLLFTMKINAYGADYKVLKGDSLFKVGTLFKTSVSSLQKSNNLSNDMIYPGQLLKVPAASYTVKTGDSLFLIAKANSLPLNSLRIMNNKWDNSLTPGQILIIPNTLTTVSKPVISYSQADLDLLARLITAESETEPYNAKVAVGAVVVNRIQSGVFATTIHDVIYQRINGYYQFTPVLNGWINKPASASAKQAALAALNGSDPSNGALFYFDDSITNQWLWSKPLTARIDKMIFVI